MAPHARRSAGIARQLTPVERRRDKPPGALPGGFDSLHVVLHHAAAGRVPLGARHRTLFPLGPHQQLGVLAQVSLGKVEALAAMGLLELPQVDRVFIRRVAGSEDEVEIRSSLDREVVGQLELLFSLGAVIS